jgi:undecaprenyl-diphosphatase
MFQVVIQLGAILAVILLFFHKLNPFSPKKDEAQKKDTWQLWFKVIVAVLPSAVIGVLLDDWMDEHLYNYVVVAIALVVYGVAFMFLEKGNTARRRKIENVYALDYKTALLIGAFQCLALIPGTSRSGVTITFARFLGMERREAAKFSMLLSIPAIIGAAFLTTFEVWQTGNIRELGWMFDGVVYSYLSSIIAIYIVMWWLKKSTFLPFVLYRIALGSNLLLDSYGIISINI